MNISFSSNNARRFLSEIERLETSEYGKKKKKVEVKNSRNGKTYDCQVREKYDPATDTGVFNLMLSPGKKLSSVTYRGVKDEPYPADLTLEQRKRMDDYFGKIIGNKDHIKKISRQPRDYVIAEHFYNNKPYEFRSAGRKLIPFFVDIGVNKYGNRCILTAQNKANPERAPWPVYRRVGAKSINGELEEWIANGKKGPKPTKVRMYFDR